jgi:hypothetical protein
MTSGAVGLGFASYGAHEARSNAGLRPKSVSRVRVAESNPDGMGRPSRAPGAQQANAEEMLAELVRLVESSALAPERSAPPVEIVPEPKQTDTEPLQTPEMTSLGPSVDPPPGKPSETRAVDVEPPPAREAANSYSNHPKGIDFATGQRPGAWTFKVSAFVLAGAAVVGSIFWLKYPGPPKAPAFFATAQAPATAQPRSDVAVATSSDAGKTPLKDIAQLAVVSPEERPIDVNASVSLNNPSPSAELGPTAVGAAPADTPAQAAPMAVSPPLASQSLDPKPVPVPTVPLPPAAMTTAPLPPDPTQIATPIPPTTNPGAAAPASDAPLPPARPAAKAAIEAPGVAQRSTPKLDLPTKLSNKSAGHVVVARADATGHLGPAETPSQPLRRGAPVKPATGAKTLDAAQATAEAQPAPSEQPAPAKQSNPNPVMHAFNSVVGAVTGLIPFVPH